jgi:hypothetical protein
MRVFPNTKDEWFALVVFPFKAYVAVVVPFYYIFRMFCPQPFLGTNVSDGTRDILLQYFLLCAPVLLLSAAIQAFVSGRRAASHTLAFAAVPTLVLLLVLLSAYRSSRWIEQHRNGARSNYRPALDAAIAFCLHSEGSWRRASEAGRYAMRASWHVRAPKTAKRTS